MDEARLEDLGAGLAPVSDGWFVVNVRDAEWFTSNTRGSRCGFENEYGETPVEFGQLGINLTILEPGQTSMVHAEENQEAFLVVAGECTLIVEGEQRLLEQWDFFHAPPWTEHGFVGAGDGPCVLVMMGARLGPGVNYPELGTSDPTVAYANAEMFRRGRPRQLGEAAVGIDRTWLPDEARNQVRE